jgi:hypothetical protein
VGVPTATPGQDGTIVQLRQAEVDDAEMIVEARVVAHEHVLGLTSR